MGTIALLNGIAPGDIAAVSGISADAIAQVSNEDWPSTALTAHRYWRYTGFDVVGVVSLELSEIQPHSAGVRAVTGISSSDSPGGAAVSALIDSNLSTRCFWSAAVAEAGGFYIAFDFGAARSIDEVRIGAFDNSTRYPSEFRWQYSDDNSAWTTVTTITGLTYPGDNTLSGAISVSGGGSHRYWRANNFQVSGSQLEISEFQPRDAGVLAVTTVTSSSAPSGGSLANLTDNNTSTVAAWSEATAEGGGFYVQFDFGGAALIDGLKLGASNNSTFWTDAITLSWSDDGSSFTTVSSKTGISYPGDNTLTSLITFP